MVKTGLERILEEGRRPLSGRRFGLLAHQASLTRHFWPAWKAFKELYPAEFCLLFSPQHGLFAEKQANMVGSSDTIEPETGLPVVSLYGPRLSPGLEHLREIDLLLIDLQDVGCRVYTYVWTMLLAMEACAQAGVEVWVLDRPNPLGRKTEGPMLEEELFSLVGLERLPLRHGLTLGELALYFREKRKIDLELKVIPMEGWRPASFYPETNLPWVPPSPNMPHFQTALVYPGQVLLEGTNLSEGRGTTRPFEFFGAPWLRPKALQAELPRLPGVLLRPIVFEPWFDKWAERACYGFHLVVTDVQKYQPVATTLTILSAISRSHEEFEWRRPPYEYEWHKWPFDIIVGRKDIRGRLKEVDSWFGTWQEELAAFEEEILPFKLYRDAFQKS